MIAMRSKRQLNINNYEGVMDVAEMQRHKLGTVV